MDPFTVAKYILLAMGNPSPETRQKWALCLGLIVIGIWGNMRADLKNR